MGTLANEGGEVLVTLANQRVGLVGGKKKWRVLSFRVGALI